MKDVVYLCLYFLSVFPVPPIRAQELPGPRDHHALVYDRGRDRVVLFGGNDVDAEGRYTWNPTTWEWDGAAWKNMHDESPGSISSMGTIFDEGSGQVVIVGGVSPDRGDLDEIWLWDGAVWKAFDGATPGVRMSSAMAWDAGRGEIVLFSGCVGRDYPSDTWIYNDETWKKAGETGPAGVCRGAMTYDRVREKAILFGGSLSSGARTNRMWAWDGETWREVDQGALRPSPRSNTLMAYDEHRNRTVLYGGATEGSVSDELWEWDGAAWHQVPKQAVWPGPREVYGLVYHTVLQKVLLYGGRTGFARPEADFWSWDGDRWERVE